MGYVGLPPLPLSQGGGGGGGTKGLALYKCQTVLVCVDSSCPKVCWKPQGTNRRRGLIVGLTYSINVMRV